MEARACGKECGKYPPPKINKPPTAVIPDMAFVIDIRGVWRAGVTPQTEKYPVITESENIVLMVRIAESAHAYPKPNIPNTPLDKAIALLRDFLNGLIGSLVSLTTAGLGADLAASNIGGFGFGHKSYFYLVTIAPLTT